MKNCFSAVISVCCLSSFHLLHWVPCLRASVMNANPFQFTQLQPAYPGLNNTIIIFFGFYCNQCYQLEHQHGFSQALEAAFPDSVVAYYAIPGEQTYLKELEALWSLSALLGCETQIYLKLHQYLTCPRSQSELRTQLHKWYQECGITQNEVERIENRFLHHYLVTYRRSVGMQCGVKKVPCIVVDGRYRLDVADFPLLTRVQFIEECIRRIHQLRRNESLWCPQ